MRAPPPSMSHFGRLFGHILGHIFEHSLNEIEEVQAEIRGEAVDKSKTKRKKDGVFLLGSGAPAPFLRCVGEAALRYHHP